MLGTHILEELVQSVALSHRVKGHRRCSLLLLAAPESGKTTITTAAKSTHVYPVALITGRSVIRQVQEHKETEFLLFNDLSSVRAMSAPAVNLLIVLLNQLTQDERGSVAFAGKEVTNITRPVGMIACLPMQTFVDHRSKWRELGFISRMIPVAYQYSNPLIMEIKNGIDDGHGHEHSRPRAPMPKVGNRAVMVPMNAPLTKLVRTIADEKAQHLGQIGIRLLQNYHCLIRAHALLKKRRTVTTDDFLFLKQIDRFVSITTCTPIEGEDRV